MSTPTPDGPQRPTEHPGADTASRSHIGSILWILLLVALIATGIWWYSEQTRVVVPQPPATTEAPPAVVDPPIAPVAPEEAVVEADRGAPVPAARSRPAPPKPQKPTATVPRDRGPVPLPTNRQPEYPARALRSGVEGSVSVLIDINAQGVPTDVRVVSRRGERSRELDHAVVSAARNWRFEPALRDGRAVPGEVILPVDFQRN